jgi:hypothetical protein
MEIPLDDMPGFDAPDEAIPEYTSGDGDFDEQASDDDELFIHCLSSSDSPIRSQIRSRPEYKKRLEAERRNWELVEACMVNAYLEYQVHGPQPPDQAGDAGTAPLSSFSCRVITLESKFLS